jgi:hypothetical protein
MELGGKYLSYKKKTLRGPSLILKKLLKNKWNLVENIQVTKKNI